MPLELASIEERVIELLGILRESGRDVLHRGSLACLRKAAAKAADRVRRGLPASEFNTVQSRKLANVLKKGAAQCGAVVSQWVLLRDGTEALIDDRGRLFILSPR